MNAKRNQSVVLVTGAAGFIGSHVCDCLVAGGYSVVALGLYRREPWLDVDSMKLFEYLAAGVPVVTTPYHNGLSTDFDGLLEFAATPPEFVSRIEGILARGESKRQPWDGRRRNFVERHTWKRRADEALRFLEAIPATE